MYNESQIAYENATHWVLQRAPNWYEVYKTGITHSVRCATYHNVANGLERAIADADKRDAGKRHSTSLGAPPSNC
jgi:hypothetical protein